MDKVEAWLSEIQSRCENRDNILMSKTTEELMPKLLSLVRVYREANNESADWANPNELNRICSPSSEYMARHRAAEAKVEEIIDG